jgi:hypothetical protein
MTRKGQIEESRELKTSSAQEVHLPTSVQSKLETMVFAVDRKVLTCTDQDPELLSDLDSRGVCGS